MSPSAAKSQSSPRAPRSRTRPTRKPTTHDARTHPSLRARVLDIDIRAQACMHAMTHPPVMSGSTSTTELRGIRAPASTPAHRPPRSTSPHLSPAVKYCVPSTRLPFPASRSSLLTESLRACIAPRRRSVRNASHGLRPSACLRRRRRRRAHVRRKSNSPPLFSFSFSFPFSDSPAGAGARRSAILLPLPASFSPSLPLSFSFSLAGARSRSPQLSFSLACHAQRIPHSSSFSPAGYEILVGLSLSPLSSLLPRPPSRRRVSRPACSLSPSRLHPPLPCSLLGIVQGRGYRYQSGYRTPARMGRMWVVYQTDGIRCAFCGSVSVIRVPAIRIRVRARRRRASHVFCILRTHTHVPHPHPLDIPSHLETRAGP
ncbi:hypothetical protein B0H11DRAFT_1955023 [Mycena galericulata]|nr:hypothetical protein B0H11DRAFT_1955023 [Mycena galericulata]